MKLKAARTQFARMIERLGDLATELDDAGFDDLAEGCERAIEELEQTLRDRDSAEFRHVQDRRDQGALR